ncbi:hypothetical protein [Fimbriimonas ginsengisoli]|uniref:Uncharacterized protein n=1 Tax=Fimbriimonas ginsengisoli Gsoil 348 TaxID=661478 RepID=A0A068NXL9_FIMGI|nr:hypothetical protein [Fimbriimonas ginsengisoli]AIE88057.1 hypothetical protein OP10G_4689 [Fimbriimonas ginsengisoli Gsoil 348]
MSKRFEESQNPSFVDLVTAYQLLGIDNLLGQPGKHTAFAQGGCTDEVVFHVVPGEWSSEDFVHLMEIAVSTISTPATLSLAA